MRSSATHDYPDESGKPARPARATRGSRPGALAPAGLATGVSGLIVLAGAVVPLVGWATSWPALASYLPGWPTTAPGAALALLACGIGLIAQSAGVPRLTRRILAAGGGLTAIMLALVLRTRAAGRPLVLDASELIQQWRDVPGAALQFWPSRAAAVAITLLGMAVALLAIERAAAQRAAWGAAVGAALFALAAGGLEPPPQLAPELAQAARAVADARAAVISPPIAWLILMGACGVLLRRSDGGPTWMTPRGGAAAVARRLLPGVLLLPPALVWITDLAERRRWLTGESANALLTLGLVTGLGAIAMLAVHYLTWSADRGRRHEERRRQRHMARDAEQVARTAEGSLRIAADRYRTHLRAILDVAPTPFLALDRNGNVAYANRAALEAIGHSAAAATGRSLADLWPEVAEAVRAAIAGAVQGAPLARTVTSADGRSLELRGYPSEDGMAVFVRDLDVRA
ncbi:MAG: PAS domain-containing protein [Gemmatimonadaceae bacterium]